MSSKHPQPERTTRSLGRLTRHLRTVVWVAGGLALLLALLWYGLVYLLVSKPH